MLKWICTFFSVIISLQNVIAQRCDTNAVNLLCERSRSIRQDDLPKAYLLALQAWSKAQACKDSHSYYEASFNLASVYHHRGYDDSVFILLEPILEKLPAGTSKKDIGNIHLRLSSAYLNKMEFEKGLKHALTALTNYEQCGDTVNTIGILVNISNVYQQQNNFKQSDKYLREAQKQAGMIRRQDPLGRVYNQMGILYAEHWQKDSAEKFFLLSTKIREKLNDKLSLPWNYNNLGGLYYMQKKMGPAREYMEKAFNAFVENGNYKGQSDVSNNLAQLYMDLKDFKKSLYYYSYSRSLYSITKNKDNLENLYNNLSEYYRITGDINTAFKYSDSLIVLKDTLYGQRLDESIAEMHTKYETEKKDLEIAKNKAELQVHEEQAFIKNVIIIGVICLLILSAIAAYAFYHKKQIQQKAELAAELAKQKEIRNRSVIEAEEKERIRIATDLHDGVGQLLSAAKLNLSSLESKLNIESPEQEIAFKNALDLLDDSVKEVRAVSHNMMPNTLLKLGLASAVKEFITKIQGTPNLKVNLEIVELNDRLEQEKETVLYRVIQEVVSNIIKHAKATQLTLQMIRHDNELSILIEDNGVGFDTSKINDFEGIGLKNIISRVDFINGTVHFDSTPDRGTTVVIEVNIG